MFWCGKQSCFFSLFNALLASHTPIRIASKTRNICNCSTNLMFISIFLCIAFPLCWTMMMMMIKGTEKKKIHIILKFSFTISSLVETHTMNDTQCIVCSQWWLQRWLICVDFFLSHSDGIRLLLFFFVISSKPTNISWLLELHINDGWALNMNIFINTVLNKVHQHLHSCTKKHIPPSFHHSMLQLQINTNKFGEKKINKAKRIQFYGGGKRKKKVFAIQIQFVLCVFLAKIIWIFCGSLFVFTLNHYLKCFPFFILKNLLAVLSFEQTWRWSLTIKMNIKVLFLSNCFPFNLNISHRSWLVTKRGVINCQKYNVQYNGWL